MRNILQDLPDNRDAEVFENIVDEEGVRVERIVSHGQSSPVSGWYDQDWHEWVTVLEGEAVVAFANGEDAHLKAGDHLMIPARCQHRVKWTHPARPTVWLAVHYPKA
ncbi:cupin domain-containing protein [Halomonas vilamensis]|uniref:Cupin domain-containing protein n=1 Tax=Vreelandella vilamensis TaxID=531309 RepID=A0ABU1H4I7_9GAMM|nr:cupin domain-containing protein [Halomonas vilamensis]MDR5899223.1 cupin domain-containing protein [Halomonas vilamensis]